jgi:pSer/pThr/pTyr-binding forkhead associated (FHA) protein
VPDDELEVPYVLLQTGNLAGERLSLDNEIFIIGRGADSDLAIQDRQVSRYHARISRTKEGYVIEDLGSKNGTHLNGVRIPGPVLLQDGDLIQIALAMEIVFIGVDATVPLSEQQATQLGLGRLKMDPQAHRVTIYDEEIEPPLSPPQYRLLELLHRNGTRVVTRDEIAEVVWPGTKGVGVSNQAIDALVRRLRDRLSDADSEHIYIETVRGLGFRFNNPV